MELYENFLSDVWQIGSYCSKLLAYDQQSSSQITVNVSQTPSSITGDMKSSILDTPSMVDDPLWYPDSEASHHITNNVNLFTTNNIYHGPEIVKIGNASCIPINDIGSTDSVVPNSNITIKLNDLLHVPTIMKNLMSVSKLLVIIMFTLFFILILVMSNIRIPIRLFFKKQLRMAYMFFLL